MAVRARALDNETGAKRPGAHGGLYKRSLLCSGWPADLAPSGRGGAWRMPTTMGGAPRDAPAGIVPLSGHVGDLLCCSHVAPCAARDMEDSVAVLRTRHGRTPWRPNATAGRDTDEPALDVVARSEGGQRSGSGHRLPACYGFALALGGRCVLGPRKPEPVPVAGSSQVRHVVRRLRRNALACLATHGARHPRPYSSARPICRPLSISGRPMPHPPPPPQPHNL